MSIFKIFKYFCVGFLTGASLTWLYKYTGFAQILSDLEIIWASIIASLAWWFKVLYEKWNSERAAISKLQQLYVHNLDTLPRLLKVIESLNINIEENILDKDNYIHKDFFIEYLKEPNEETSYLRNVDLLNIIFKNSIHAKRFNALLKKFIEGYNSSSLEVKKEKSVSETLLGELRSELKSLKEYGESLNEDVFLVTANLFAYGEAIKKSMFYKLGQLSVYDLPPSRVEYHLEFIKNQINQK